MSFISRVFGKTTALVFVFLLALPVTWAPAANSLENGGSENLKLKPTDKAGAATGTVDINATVTGDNNDNNDNGDDFDNNGDDFDNNDDLDEDTGNDNNDNFDDNGDNNDNFDDNGDNNDNFDDNGDNNDNFDDNGDNNDNFDDNGDNNDNFDDNGDNNDNFDDNGDNNVSDQTSVTGDVEAKNLQDTARVEAFLVDNEGGRSVDLGRLTKQGNGNDLQLNFSEDVDNLGDFDKVVVSREPANDTDPNPSAEVLFSADLPDN